VTVPDLATHDESVRAARRFGARTVIAFTAIFLVAVPFGVLTTLIVTNSADLLSVDRHVASALHGYALDHPTVTHLMRGVGAVFSAIGWWIILTPVVAWLLVRRRPRLAAFVAVTAIGSSLLNGLIKTTVHRARPHFADPVATAVGKSFPSGHTQAATVGFGLLVLVFLPFLPARTRPWAWVGAAFMVVLVGFSRVALGVHYLTDVVGALLIGSAWLLAMTAAFSAWRSELHRPVVPISEGLEPEPEAMDGTNAIAPD
jgi:membrane-associated phospholipid phosphatase